MIAELRRSLKNRSMRVIVGLILASVLFGAGFISMLTSVFSRSRPGSVGTVNGLDISEAEFQRRMREFDTTIRKVRDIYGPQAEMVLKMWGLDRRPEELVLDILIGEKTMKSASESFGARVHPDYAKSKLRDASFASQHLTDLVPPEAYRNGVFDASVMRAHLKRMGISGQEFEEYLHDALVKMLMLSLVEGGSYVPDSTLQDAYIGHYLKKKFGYIALPRAKYLEQARKQTLSDEEIADFYAQPAQQEQYTIPEKRSAKVWEFTPENFGVVVTDDDLASGYLAYRKEFLVSPAKVEVQHIQFAFTEDNKVAQRAKAQEVYKELVQNPELFKEKAQEYSASKDKGNTITLTRDEGDKIFTKTAFDLHEGGMSPVIETADGFEIIKLIDKKKAVFKPMEDVSDLLHERMMKRNFEGAFANNAERVVSQARDDKQFLTKFIESKKGKEKSVKNVTRSERPQQAKIFGLRRVGDVGFYQDGGKGYFVELTAITPSIVPELAKVREKVETSLYTNRALQALSADIKRSIEAINSGSKTLAQVAQELDGTVEMTDWVSFADRDSTKKIEQLNIKFPVLAKLTKQGAVASDVTDKNGIIIQVKQMEPFGAQDFNVKKDELRKQLSNQEQQGLAASFVQALRDAAKIDLLPEFSSRVYRS